MLNIKRKIQEGDKVVLYSGKDRMSLVVVKNDNTIFNSKFGNYRIKNLIGVEYGSKVYSNDEKGFLHAIALNPELWSITLDHRTQILFNLDISTIIFNLELKNGSKVVESGTGSGSLSTSIARTVAPLGHLYTFEFHKERAEHAIRDFTENGIKQYITVTHRDACVDGFKLENVEGMVGYIDAVFLDLPCPWEAIDNAVAVMHHGSMLCSFSPCIEQVQNTCLKLSESSFQEITTIEVLIRTYDTKYHKVESMDLVNPYDSTNTINNEEVSNSSSNTDEKPQQRQSTKWGQSKPQSFTVGEMKGTKKDQFLTNVIKESRGHTGYLTFARYIKEE
ncbi:tRNA-methyltransferase subunit [Tieghemostelium lacteum]|uniref:tRNA (adenine(58)-N(1))-methyltransferase n=1 Tax=Tieghemostelium lacteum TaxID=361077 RepID=A0A152A5M0_TIELA|nr:tRNA-methyltransferase subunit [Tieghemostelium lacteum]|eukprot:KYR01518.1 tRNA-methyltransferase subunit [Tieghemostelium lacteum]